MATIDLTAGLNPGTATVTGYPRSAAAVTKSDTNEFSKPVTVYVGGAGTVTVEPWDNPGVSVTFVMPAGGIVPVQVRKVLSTGTEATHMVAMY